MNTIDNIMKLADEFRYARTYEWDASDAVEAGQALRAAVTELASTATEYQQAADKMAMDHKVERDTLTKRISELESIEKQNSDTIIWQADEIANHLNTIESSRKQEPVAWKYTHIPSWHTEVSLDHPEKTYEWDDLQLLEIEPLFAAPVVDDDQSKRIAELEALIDASRKQEAVATVEMHPDGRRRTIFKDSVTDCDASWKEKQKLYAAPVVALDVLKDAQRYRFLRKSNGISGSGIGALVKSGWLWNLDFEKLDTVIDAAMGGAND